MQWIRLIFYFIISLTISEAFALQSNSPAHQNMQALLDRPLFDMVETIEESNLLSGIQRKSRLTAIHDDLAHETQYLANIVLAEYYIAFRDFSKARHRLNRIEINSKAFQNLEDRFKARYFQAHGVTLGYKNTLKHHDNEKLEQGLIDFKLAGEIFKTDPKQVDELFRNYFNKARHYYWLGDIPAARTEIESAQKLLPRVRQDGYKSAYYFIRGNIELAQKEFAAAKENFQKSRFFMNDLFKKQNLPYLIEANMSQIKKNHTAHN